MYEYSFFFVCSLFRVVVVVVSVFLESKALQSNCMSVNIMLNVCV